MIRRVVAIVRADFLIRFRRPSTLVVFLLLSALAYLWVPAPSTGRALMQVGGQRVLYNSAAIGMATAMLASLFVGLAGFYVISNAIRRDVESRCGAIIAATNVGSVEYLIAKFLGNVAFLITFIGGFMVASMIMQVVRGEAPLQPLTFLWQYGLMVPGTVTFVAVLALLFECVPWLSGRFGDVAYFLLWAGSFGAIAAGVEGKKNALRFFDFTSLGFVIATMQETFHTNNVNIGSSSFDPSKGLVVMGRLPVAEILPRITSMFGPVVLLPLALLFFHRFDPARTKSAAARSKGSWLGRVNAMAKPLSRAVFSVAPRGPAVTDAMATFTMMPVAVVLLLGVFIAGLLARGALPVAIVAAGIAVADISCRDRRSGTVGLIYAAPHLRERFALWKFASSSVVAGLFMAGSFIRAALHEPALLPALIVATLFIAAAATAIGLLSANPKAFLVLFLTVWYIAVNERRAGSITDFAGFVAPPPIHVVAVYAGLTALFVVTAIVAQHVRLRSA